MNIDKTNWETRLDEFIQNKNGTDLNNSYAKANIATIKRVIEGKTNSEYSARMVVNISSAHIPAFCDKSGSDEERSYKNGYNLGKFQRLGNIPSNKKLKNRAIVDESLPLPPGTSPENIYFGAIELNAAGIRFYGDMCLVLSQKTIDAQTIVLDRNSFDLIHSPLCDDVNDLPDQERIEKLKKKAKKLYGIWQDDIGTMAALKTLSSLGLCDRLYTTGQISRAIRNDEDYFEVLKTGSFSTKDLEEVRLSVADAAHDAVTGDQLDSEYTPRFESLMWRHRRRIAETELRSCGIPVRVITTSGRTKD